MTIRTTVLDDYRKSLSLILPSEDPSIASQSGFVGVSVFYESKVLSRGRAPNLLADARLFAFFCDAATVLGGELFVVVSPFQAIKSDCAPSDAPFEIGNFGALWYTETNDDSISAAWERRDRCAEYGDWMIGLCSRRFEMAETRSAKSDVWTLEAILGQLDRVSLISIGFVEGSGHIVLSRPYNGAQKILKGFGTT